VQQLFGQSSGQYYYGDCVKFEGDAADVIQPLENVNYGQSVVLNVKTCKLYVKICNAGSEAKKANVDLSRFGIRKNAVKTVISGAADDENNYEKQPVAPQQETVKAQKKFTLDVAPYSFIMLEYSL
jgi:alpha-L-arabinofuranosidase